MTPPWPPPSDHPAPTTGWTKPPAAPTAPWWGPPVGWLATVAGFFVMVVGAVAQPLPWAIASAPGAPLRGLDGPGLVDSPLVPLPLLSLTVVVAFGGLVAAPLFGLAAVPGARWGRWVVTVALLALLGTFVVVAFRDAADQAARPYGGGDAVYTETIAILGLLFVLPTLLLLLLTWRARRGAAITAAVVAVAAVVAHLGTLGMLAVYPPRIGEGAWVVLLAVLLTAAGTLLMVRTTPRKQRRAPALQPGDPGWTA